MKTLRLSVLASVVAVLSGCPSDKCKDVSCPSGQSCDPGTGLCTTGGTGGGTGNTGGGTGGNTGGGTGGGTIDAGPPIPVNMVCDKIAEVQCDKRIRCQQVDVAERSICIAVARDNCPVARDVNGMVAQYDGAAAAQCIARLAVSSCYDNDAPPECAAAFVGGKGRSGTPCITTSNCQADAGLYCRSVSGCGTCTAFSAAGAPCNSASTGRPATTCQPGLSCSNSTDGGTCVTPRPPGQPCTTVLSSTTNGAACQLDAGFCPEPPNDGGARLCQPFGGAGAPCSFSDECQAGLFCNAMSQCEAPHPADTACESSEECQMGLYCPAPTVTPRTCRQLSADGQPCSGPEECTSAYCNRYPFYYGNFDVLDAGPESCGYLAANDPCFIDEDCGPGRHCKDFHLPREDAGFVFGQCASMDPDGGACTNSETRFADSCANPDATCLDNKCVVTKPYTRMAGQTCDQASQCAYPTYCAVSDPFTLEGECSGTFVDAGLPCDYRVPAQCGPGAECFFDSNANTDTCLPLARRGEACDFEVGPSCMTYNDCVVADGGVSGVCVPWSGPGGMCSPDVDGTSCYSSFCQADAGSCTLRQMVNASCTSATQCESGRCVNLDGGTGDRSCVMACY